jgi:hypothetical protein
MAVLNASQASVKLFKGFLGHLGLNPPSSPLMAKNKSVGTENQNKMAQSTAFISNLIFFDS